MLIEFTAEGFEHGNVRREWRVRFDLVAIKRVLVACHADTMVSCIGRFVNWPIEIVIDKQLRG